MGLAKITMALMMVALFSIALVTFAINYGIDNNAQINLGQDDEFVASQSELRSNVEVFYSDVNISNDAFQSSTISSQTEASEGGTQFKVTPTNSLSMFKNALKTSFTKIFGSDSGFGILLTALISIVGFLVGLYAWRAWKGNP